MNRKSSNDDEQGSVFEEGEGSGKWRAQLYINGRIVRRRASSERAAYAKLRELHDLRDQGLQVGSGRQTLDAWFTSWLATKERSLKVKTAEGYREVYDRYISPHLGKHRIERLRAQHIDTWIVSLRSQGLSEATIANAYRRLHAALEAAARKKVISSNPATAAEKPHPTTQETSALDDRQIARLLTELETHRLYPLYAVSALLGLRQGEAMGLRWSAVTLDGDTPSLRIAEQLQRVKDAQGKRQIHRETPKGRRTKPAKVRHIPLSVELVTVLRAWQTRQLQEQLILGERWHGDDLVFTSEDGGPHNPSNLRRHLKASLTRASLPKVTWHSLRHSAGSIMLKLGVDIVTVSKILGHSSPAVTATIYAHSFEESRRQAVERVSGALLRRQ